MTYTSRNTGPLLPQEQDVRAALKHFEACDLSREHWITVATLWRAYVTWWAVQRWDWKRDPTFPGQYPRLTPRQFGHAVRRVFPGARRERRRRLRLRDRVYGYRGVRVRE